MSYQKVSIEIKSFCLGESPKYEVSSPQFKMKRCVSEKSISNHKKIIRQTTNTDIEHNCKLKSIHKVNIFCFSFSIAKSKKRLRQESKSNPHSQAQL